MNRAQFLQLSSSALAGLFISDLDPGKRKKFGIQLYAVRGMLEKDPVSTIRAIGKLGYTYVESYERSAGMFWGMKNTEFKQLMNETGLQIVSSHCNIHEQMEKKAEQASAIGMSYLVCDWINAPTSEADMIRTCKEFESVARICKNHGLGFAYHNHRHDFMPVNGIIPMEYYIANTDPALVDYQMDIFHTSIAGQSPITWLEKYPTRFRLLHLKDGHIHQDPPKTCDLGKGDIDFKSIISLAKKQQVKFYFAEQEEYEGTTELASAAANAKYLSKKL